jgi:hypothetical protein
MAGIHGTRQTIQTLLVLIADFGKSDSWYQNDTEVRTVSQAIVWLESRMRFLAMEERRPFPQRMLLRRLTGNRDTREFRAVTQVLALNAYRYFSSGFSDADLAPAYRVLSLFVENLDTALRASGGPRVSFRGHGRTWAMFVANVAALLGEW